MQNEFALATAPDADTITARDTQVPATDGYLLAATIHGRQPDSRQVVIVNSATAVPRQFYRHYAGALANAGFTVVTYDYRGTGGSRPASLRGFDGRTRDWALKDMTSMLDWVQKRFLPERISMVGHSIGGQVAGLIENSHLVDGMVTISAQSGHWRLQGGEQKYLACFHVHVTLPLLAHVLGYMPWSWVAGGEDLPKGAALEWSRWCRDRDYLLGDDTLPLERFKDFEAPVLAYSIDDDKWGTARSVDAMMSAYPNVERQHLVPGDYDLDAIGHFGYFRPAAKALWTDSIEWLQRGGGA